MLTGSDPPIIEKANDFLLKPDDSKNHKDPIPNSEDKQIDACENQDEYDESEEELKELESLRDLNKIYQFIPDNVCATSHNNLPTPNLSNILACSGSQDEPGGRRRMSILDPGYLYCPTYKVNKKGPQRPRSTSFAIPFLYGQTYDPDLNENVSNPLSNELIKLEEKQDLPYKQINSLRKRASVAHPINADHNLGSILRNNNSRGRVSFTPLNLANMAKEKQSTLSDIPEIAITSPKLSLTSPIQDTQLTDIVANITSPLPSTCQNNTKATGNDDNLQENSDSIDLTADDKSNKNEVNTNEPFSNEEKNHHILLPKIRRKHSQQQYTSSAPKQHHSNNQHKRKSSLSPNVALSETDNNLIEIDKYINAHMYYPIVPSITPQRPMIRNSNSYNKLCFHRTPSLEKLLSIS